MEMNAGTTCRYCDAPLTRDAGGLVDPEGFPTCPDGGAHAPKQEKAA